jgi:hypothetical protein
MQPAETVPGTGRVRTIIMLASGNFLEAYDFMVFG